MTIMFFCRSFLAQTLGMRFERTAEVTLQSLIPLIPNSAKVMSTSGLVGVKMILSVRSEIKNWFLLCLLRVMFYVVVRSLAKTHTDYNSRIYQFKIQRNTKVRGVLWICLHEFFCQ